MLWQQYTRSHIYIRRHHQVCTQNDVCSSRTSSESIFITVFMSIQLLDIADKLIIQHLIEKNTSNPAEFKQSLLQSKRKRGINNGLKVHFRCLAHLEYRQGHFLFAIGGTTSTISAISILPTLVPE